MRSATETAVDGRMRGRGCVWQNSKTALLSLGEDGALTKTRFAGCTVRVDRLGLCVVVET
jgi:hypothetical protein